MERQTFTAVSLLLGACVLLGCDPATELSQSEHELRASPSLKSEIEMASADFELGMQAAYALPDAPKEGSYGFMLQGYLNAAAQQDVAATSAELHAIHTHLQAASAREFVMFYRTLVEEVLSEAVDTKGNPILRPIDEAATPLVLLLHDMGARDLDSELATWLFLRRLSIAKAWAKPGLLSNAGVFVDYGTALLRLPLEDQSKVIDAIVAGTIFGGCGLDELQTPVGDIPMCPSECEFDLDKLDLDSDDLASMQAWCDTMGEAILPELNPDTSDTMLSCLHEYEQAVERTDLAVCLVESFVSLSSDPFPSFESTTRVRVAEECALSTTEPEDVAESAGLDAAQGGESLETLERRRQALLAAIEAAAVDETTFEILGDEEWVTQVVQPLIQDLWQEYYDVANEIADGGGSFQCSMDSESCTTQCDIETAVQQATEACIQSTSDDKPQKVPEPIDPPQPIVDPESPIGVLVACLADAALSDEDTTECGSLLECANGKPADVIDGVCLCSAEASVMPPEVGCDETIQCAESPCSCDMEPILGFGGPPPQPDLYLVLEYRG